MMSENIAVSVLLIDGENVPARYADEIMGLTGRGLAEARVYGDFSNPAMQGWRDCAAQYGLRLNQTAGKPGSKNSADMLLTIDAMDLLWVAEYQGFCIVSGDRDFVPLAIRLRRAGKTVVGIGTDKANVVLREACDRFHVLSVEKAKLAVIVPPPLAELEPAALPKPAAPPAPKRDLLMIFETVRAELIADAQGWFHGGGVGSAIRKKFPGFEWQDYGASTLGKVFAAHPRFETKTGGYIRLKEKSASASVLRVVDA